MKNRMIILGEKESFISRVLVSKVTEAGVRCDFIPFTINNINENIGQTSLVTLFVPGDDRPPADTLHFLSEKMEDKGLQMIVAGDQLNVQYVCDNFPNDLIFKTFVRPIDNTAYAECVADYVKKFDEGEFRKSILVVDDDPSFLSLVREWLRSTYRVSMANSGLQAIKWLGSNKVDLILLDYEMPVTNGPQVLEMLRADDETKNIPVMFLTGKGDKESVMKVVSLKPEGYFLKTIQKDELLEKLDEFFIVHK